jgi:deoxyribonuclease IV
MPTFGAHMSTAGGCFRAIERASALSMDCVQIFTKNNNQWACKPLSDDDVQAFRDARTKHSVRAPIAHASYLINLAATDEGLWAKSLDAIVVEWERANQLALDGLVVHPGALVGATLSFGLERIATAIQQAIERVPEGTAKLLLENTAGQGTCVGHRLEELQEILAKVDAAARVGVCIDTCHAHAAGYRLDDAQGFAAFKESLRTHVGLDSIKALHVNDCKKPAGCRVDRHEHIGHGTIGREGFRLIVNDPDFAAIPMYLETAKENDDSGNDWDAINLATLRELVGATAADGPTTIANVDMKPSPSPKKGAKEKTESGPRRKKRKDR